MNNSKTYNKNEVLEARMRMSPVIIATFIFLAIVMFLVGIPKYLETKKFVDMAISTKGIIIEIEKGTRKTRAGTTKHAYYTIYTFIANNGEEFRGRSSVPRGHSDSKIGDQVTILYKPNSPNNSKLETFSDLWMDSICINFLGIFISFLSVVVIIQYKKYLTTHCRQSRERNNVTN